MNIGNKIIEIRKRENLSQEQFAEMFHVTRQTVSNWENNRNYPDMDSLKQISNRFGISFDELLKEDDELISRIDKTRKKAKKNIAFTIVPIVIGVLLAFLPKIMNNFYYDPSDLIFKAIPEEGVYYEPLQRFEVDIRVYNELYNPTWDFDVSQINELGYGNYNFTMGRSIVHNGSTLTTFSGKVEKNQIVFFNPDAIKIPPTNAFEWSINHRDIEKSIEENLNEKDIQSQVMSGDKESSDEGLNELEPDKLYIGYVTFNKIRNYESAYKLIEDLDEYTWMGIVTDDEINEVIGLDPSKSMYDQYDTKAYPKLLGQYDDSKEEEAREHFISMLNYISRQQVFNEMMENAGFGKSIYEENTLKEKIDYVKKNGLKVYGFALIAMKDGLLKINDMDNVYCIATEPYNQGPL